MGLATKIASGSDRLTENMLRGTEKFGDKSGQVGSKAISASVAAIPGATIALASTYFAVDHVLPALQNALNAPTDPHYTVDANKIVNVGVDAVGLGACAFGAGLGATMAVRGAAKALSKKASAAIDG